MNLYYGLYYYSLVLLFLVQCIVRIPRVLALCGISGCGKSTTVELLCNELHIDLIQWNEDNWDIDNKGSSYTHSAHAYRRSLQNSFCFFLFYELFALLEIAVPQQVSCSQTPTLLTAKHRETIITQISL